MATLILRDSELPFDWNLADLQQHLGGVPLERIRLYPPPGTATEDDVLALHDRDDRIFELCDGTLVQKTVGWYESFVAICIAARLKDFLDKHKLGIVLGADGALRILPKRVRAPDVSFISWQRLPENLSPKRRIPAVVPDLAVEVLSEGNTRAEMDRKLREYFEAGVRLVWYVDPAARSARVFTALDDVTELNELGVLKGGEVLPGFELPLKAVFDEAATKRP